MYYIKRAVLKIYNRISKPIRSEVVLFVGIALFFAIAFLCFLGSSTLLKYAYILCRTTSELAFYFVVIKLICSIYALIKYKKINNLKTHAIWLSVLIVFSLPHLPRIFGYTTTQIGDYYEKAEYTENYVVFMSREPQKNENRKVYTLTAKISRSEDYMSSEISNNYITCEQHETDITMLCYHIEKLYFNNGGYLNFDEVDSEYTILEPNKEYSVEDNKGDTYYITLTKQKAR